MNGNKPCGEDRESRWAPTRPVAATFGFGSTSKIRDVHVNRLAMVYVRQSSPQQVLENRESRERQYALAEFAQRLGWSAERVVVVDEDQGQSGKTASERSGFQRRLVCRVPPPPGDRGPAAATHLPGVPRIPDPIEPIDLPPGYRDIDLETE